MRNVRRIIAVLLMTVAALGLTTVGTAQAATPVTAAAVSCNYWVDYSPNNVPGPGDYLPGFTYAGNYSGLTAVPSKTVWTSSGAEAQCLLERQGFGPGTIDGIFGKNSQAAMKSLQQWVNSSYSAGLTVDGLPGPKSWPWLRWYVGDGGAPGT